MPLQHLHDAPPTGAATIFEVGVNGWVGLAGEALLDLVHGLVLAVTIPLPAVNAGPPEPALSRPALYPAIGWSSS